MGRGRCGTMVIIKLDLDCIHFARQKFQRRVNEQCDQSEGGERERGAGSHQPPLQATPLNGRFRRCCCGPKTLWEWGAQFLNGNLTSVRK